MIGTTLGPYRIVEKLGAGGMGEVYRARDTRLDRDVALKILPETFAQDTDRLARFEREAKTLASLNHPHIAQIHGFETSDAVKALVMELVEGDDLAARIRSGPVPVDEAILIARQIAEALEAAHEQGIIHRDLKPANIKVRADGTVKVLDFGLAKAIAPRISEGPGPAVGATITSPATMQGVILGTAAYMSPEQARGKVVDKRSDVWAFGCVVYELLSGRPAFGGDSVTDTLSAITRDDPDWNRLPLTTPAAVRRLLPRCLSKDPKRRLRDIGDAVLELDAALDANEPISTSSTRRLARGVPLWLFVVALGVAVAGAIVVDRLLRRVGSSQSQPVVRFHVQAPDLRVDGGRHPVTSPDGRRMAWQSAGSLWVRDLDRLEARIVVNGGDPLYATWSPDSEEVLFFSANRLSRVRAAFGEPVVVAEATVRRGLGSPGAAWLDDGRIVFAPAANGNAKANGRCPPAAPATWTARGDALMYSQGARIIEVPMTFQAAVALGPPRVVFERGSTRAVLGAGFDVMNDGRTIIFTRVPPSAGETTGVITVVQNWLEDFRPTAPGR